MTPIAMWLGLQDDHLFTFGNTLRQASINPILFFTSLLFSSLFINFLIRLFLSALFFIFHFTVTPTAALCGYSLVFFSHHFFLLSDA